MKNKILSILLSVAIILLIVLTGCGNTEPNQKQNQGQSSAESKEDILFGSSVLQMLSERVNTPTEETEIVNISGLVDEMVQNVAESAEKVGGETSIENEPETFAEDPFWPVNEYTKQISKPDFEIVSAGVDEIGFFAAFASAVATKDVIAYVEVIQDSGFKIDIEIDARAHDGESRYLFSAYNKAGYFVEIYWYSSGSGMAMRK